MGILARCREAAWKAVEANWLYHSRFASGYVIETITILLSSDLLSNLPGYWSHRSDRGKTFSANWEGVHCSVNKRWKTATLSAPCNHCRTSCWPVSYASAEDVL